MNELVIGLHRVSQHDIAHVGGKNASLGKMLSQLSSASIQVPGGFATTVDAYRAPLTQDNLKKRIASRLSGIDVDNISQLSSAG